MIPQALSLRQAQNYWYHWLMALDRGARLVREDRHGFTRYIWSIWNPRLAVSGKRSCRYGDLLRQSGLGGGYAAFLSRALGLAPRVPAFEALETRITADPVIRVSTLVLHGAVDPCNDPITSEGKEPLFAGSYRRQVLDGLGHFPQRQRPDLVAAELVLDSPCGRQLLDSSIAAPSPDTRPI